ncbi:MAG: RMD1 family protein [Nanoarchaeota archaeon]|nr:RMD1 family protein [Nanoarchaeota archaeon]
MAEHLFKAVFLAKELPIVKIKDVLKYKLVSEKRDRAVFEIAPKKYVFVYSFGALVFYDVEDLMVSATIKNLRGLKVEILKEKIWDEYKVIDHVKNSIEFNLIRMKSSDIEHISLVALVLAQSVALEFYENQVDSMVTQFSPLNRQLSEKGKLSARDKQILKVVGSNNAIIEVIVSKLSLLEEPASAWESEEMEWLFNRLHYMFEIEERFKHVQYKLGFVQNNSELMLEVLRGRRDAMLEWIIIILIAVEIAMFVYELWLM